jgi:hypothetical protein
MFHEQESGPLPYDLSKDEGEKNNIAAQFPEVVRKLSAVADEWSSALPKEYGKDKSKRSH